MAMTGRCYCGSLRYEITEEAIFNGQCHCRECQFISGGGPNVVMGVPTQGLSYTQGEPTAFTRDDLESPVTREFCAKCGTHILGRPPGMGMDVVKVGTLDDPSQFIGPQVAIFMCDAQPYHVLPEGVTGFDKTPG